MVERGGGTKVNIPTSNLKQNGDQAQTTVTVGLLTGLQSTAATRPENRETIFGCSRRTLPGTCTFCRRRSSRHTSRSRTAAAATTAAAASSSTTRRGDSNVRPT